MKKLHRAGGKITGTHTTVIDASATVVDVAVKLDQVTKISLSIIQHVRSKKRRLKFREISAGWEVSVYGNVFMQVIYLYTADRQAVKAALEHIFD